MANTKKVSRKELLKSPDKFFTTYEKIYNWLQKNCRAALLAAGVILALILGYALFSWNKERQALAAMNAYDQAGILMYEGKPEEAEAALFKLRADYPNSGPARFALLDLARLRLNKGETGLALELTEKFLNSLKAEEDSLKPFVFDRLGGLYEIDGQLGKAAEYYKKTLEFLPLKENGLLNLARVYQSQDKKTEALELYKQVVADYPGSRNMPLATYNIALLTPLAELEGPGQDGAASPADPDSEPEARKSPEAAFMEEELAE